MDLGDGSSWLFLTLQIVIVDLLLGADNALVIALACRSLAPQDMRRAATIGIAGAIVFRLVMTMLATSLLAIPLVKIVAALVLTTIAMNISGGGLDAPPPNRRRGAPSQLWSAAAVIVVADAAMSIDNVVALAAIARGNFWLLAIGVGLSLPILGYGGMLLHNWLGRAPGLVALGAALLGWIAGDMAISDPAVAPWANADAPGLVAIAPALGAIFVWLYGLVAVKPAVPTLPPRADPDRAGPGAGRVLIVGLLVLVIAAGAFLAMAAYLDSYLTRGGRTAGADASSQAGVYRP
jgi:YjbE family integral membrane protein